MKINVRTLEAYFAEIIAAHARIMNHVYHVQFCMLTLNELLKSCRAHCIISEFAYSPSYCYNFIETRIFHTYNSRRYLRPHSRA